MRFDTAILDLDGVVYIGPDAVPHAITALNALAAEGTRLAAATNNANRPSSEVARHLQQLGLAIQPDDVMTSAQAAAAFLAQELPTGSPVLAVGGAGVSEALTAEGLLPLRASADLAQSSRVADQCAAVMVGYGPLVAWFDLAAAHWAIDRGKRWVATNTDPTVPLPFGRAPGNGAMVGLLERSTGRAPEVIGKPQPALFEALLERVGGTRALVIGDRLDTDIDGAIAAGIESLLVFTGVHGPQDLAARPFADWPSFVAQDLRSLQRPVVELGWVEGRVECSSQHPTVQAVVAAANASWQHQPLDPPLAFPTDASPLIDIRPLRHGTV